MRSKMSTPEADPGRASSFPVRQLRVMAGPTSLPHWLPQAAASGPASPLWDLRPRVRRPSATSSPPLAPLPACPAHHVLPACPAIPASPERSQHSPGAAVFVAVAGEADGGQVALASPERRAGLGSSGSVPRVLWSSWERKAASTPYGRREPQAPKPGAHVPPYCPPESPAVAELPMTGTSRSVAWRGSLTTHGTGTCPLLDR